jgi:hypothetical protein
MYISFLSESIESKLQTLAYFTVYFIKDKDIHLSNHRTTIKTNKLLLILLHAGVEGPCLHKPENWLVRQLNDESKLVYKVGIIREKGKATAREE